MALTQLTKLSSQAGISTTIDYTMSDLVVDTISVGGTITYNDVTSVDSIGIVTARKGIQVIADGINVTGLSTFSNGLKIPDGQNLTLGSDGDIGMKHQSGHFEITNSTGNTYFNANGQLVLRNNQGGSVKELINGWVGVDIKYDNNTKLSTTSGGINVDGKAIIDGVDVTQLTNGATNNGIFLNSGDTGAGNRPYIDLKGSGTSALSGKALRVYYDNGGTESFYVDYEGNISGKDITISDKIIHTGDTNTFISFPAADTVSFETAGSEALRIDSNQRVMIGSTSSGGWKFRVQVPANASYQSAVNFTNNVNADLQFEIKNSESRLGSSTNTPLVFKTNNTERLNISSSAVAASGVVMRANDGFVSDTNLIFNSDHNANNSTNDSIIFQNRGNELVRIKGTGKVGVGVVSPTRTLTIQSNGGQLALNDTDNTQGEFFVNAGNLSAYCRGNSNLGDGSTGGYFTVHTHPAGGSIAERLRITSAGVIETKTRSAEVRRMILSGSPSNNAFNIEAHDGETGTSSGDVQGKLGLFYNDGSTLNNTACISFERGSGAPDGAMAFVTNQVERLRIASNGKVHIGADVTDFSDAGTFLNLRNNTYGGRIGFSNNTGTAGVTLMEQFCYWGTNKVAGIIATAGTSNSSKDDGYLRFYTKTAGVGAAERLRIHASGNVSIIDSTSTQTAADSTLQVNGTNNTNNIDLFRLRNTAGSAGTACSIIFENGVDDMARIQSYHDAGGGDKGGLRFWTAATKNTLTARMDINKDGVVQIGDEIGSIQSDVLQCIHTDNSQTYTSEQNNAAPLVRHLTLRNPSNTTDTMCGMNFSASSGMWWVGMVKYSTWASSPLVFGNRDGGSTWKERVRIAGNGSLLIGTTSNSTIGGQTPLLNVNGYSNLGGLRVKGTDSGNTIWKTGGHMGLTVDGNYDMTFAVNSTQTMTIDGSRGMVLISNQDHGNVVFNHRGSRTLHSNGVGWDGNQSTDGADPMLVLSVANRAGNSDIGDALGLLLHSESQDNNDYGPLVAWSSRSNSGNYNSIYGAIVGRRTGQGADSNWNAGELNFFTNDDGSYMTSTPCMRIDKNGYVTTPKQVSFNAGIGADTTSASNYMIFTTAYHNIGGCYNTSNGIFTCPVAGVYIFTITGLYTKNNSSATWKLVWSVNNTNKGVAGEWQTGAFNNSYNTIGQSSIIYSLAENDTVRLQVHGSSFHVSGQQTRFCGHLLG